MQHPPTLHAGSRVALVAPSSALIDDSDLERAKANARAFGWEVVAGEHVRERVGYLAGTDAHRVADLNRFAADPNIDAIWCVRGGYGAMRLLDHLDYDAWTKYPKTLIGYSDITALHSAIGPRARLVTYHGPTGRSELTAFSRASLLQAVTSMDDPCGVAPDAMPLRNGSARGRLVGGNLALLAALTGTRYAPPFDGAILVIEDVNESVYRLDRMLTQLQLSGALDQVAGIAFGQFTEIPDEPNHAGRTLQDVLAEIAERQGVPCLANIPLGHVNDQWTVPLGAMAVLDAGERSLVVERPGD